MSGVTEEPASIAEVPASIVTDEPASATEGHASTEGGPSIADEPASATAETAAPMRAPATAVSPRADVLGALAVIVVTIALVFGPEIKARLGAHPSVQECEQLLARYVEMRERSVTAKLDPKQYEAALREAKDLAGPTFSDCTHQVTLDEAECARTANGVDEIERCLR